MPAEVFGAVLPFAVRIVGRWVQDPRTMLRGPFVMANSVLHPCVHGVCVGSRPRPLEADSRFALRSAQVGDDDGTVAEQELRPVLGDAKPHSKPEGVAEPIRSLSHVGIGEHRNDRRRRNRPVCNHIDLLS